MCFGIIFNATWLFGFLSGLLKEGSGCSNRFLLLGGFFSPAVCNDVALVGYVSNYLFFFVSLPRMILKGRWGFPIGASLFTES